MGTLNDPFEPVAIGQQTDQPAPSALWSAHPIGEGATVPVACALTARVQGFDLNDRPMLADLALMPGEVVCARSTVALTRQQIGAQVLVLFEQGDVRRPIIVGVLQERSSAQAEFMPAGPRVSIQADNERVVVSAEREIVLRCGDASITLTRAGKVIIKGNYILSRSSGYNKIKGAAVDIN